MKFDVSYRQIFQLAYPIMIGSLAHTAINVINTGFLAHVGEAELGASALGGILFYVLVFVGAGFGTGLQILVARRTGESRDGEVGSAVDHAWTISISLSVLFFALLKWGTPVLLPYLVHDAEVLRLTIDYLDVRAYEIFFGLNFWMCRGLYTGIGRNNTIAVATVALAVVNITLDYAFIFGNWGFPAMGIRGAGWSSVCAEFVASAILVGGLYRMGAVKKYQLFRFRAFSAVQFRQLSELSMPIVLQNFVSMGSWFMFFIVMEDMGTRALAASNLIRSLYMVCMVPTWALATAANAMVSNVIGQNKRWQVQIVIRRVLMLALPLSGTLALLLAFLPRTMLNLYIAGSDKVDPATLTEAIPGLYVIAAVLVLLSFAAVLIHAVTGTGATRFAFKLEVGMLVFYQAWVLITAFVLHSPLYVVWMAEGVYWILMIAGSWWYLRRGTWRQLTV
jgi:putative MATE family efflux protein